MNVGAAAPAQDAPVSGFRQEAAALLRLGAPIVATQVFVMGTGFSDVIMSGHYSTLDLAGVALGGAVLWPVFMFMTGLTMAVTPMVSQLVGARRTDESGGIIWQGAWLALFAALLTMAIIRNAAPVFTLMGVEADAAQVAVEYLRAVSWGMPPAMIYIALRQGSEGLGHAVPPMVIAGFALALNVPLNYLLIFGAFGFPELGGVGCGWATAAVMWCELGMMTLVTRRPYFRAARILRDGISPRWRMNWRILKIGVPIGATIFLEAAVFSVIGLLIARLGNAQMAANSVAGQLNWMTYVIPMCLGSAAAIRVGFQVGAENLPGARRVAAIAVQMSLAYGLVVSLLLIAFRHFLASVLIPDAEVVAIAANLLVFIAIYQVFDDANATLAGALRGYKDTRAPMIFSLVGYWAIALPIGELLARGGAHWPAYGVYGYWAGMTFGLFLVSLCMAARLWRTSRNAARIGRLALG